MYTGGPGSSVLGPYNRASNFDIISASLFSPSQDDEDADTAEKCSMISVCLDGAAMISTVPLSDVE